MTEQVVKLRDIPETVVEKLREIAIREQKFLYEVYRDALVSYAETHK